MSGDDSGNNRPSGPSLDELLRRERNAHRDDSQQTDKRARSADREKSSAQGQGRRSHIAPPSLDSLVSQNTPAPSTGSRPVGRNGAGPSLDALLNQQETSHSPATSREAGTGQPAARARSNTRKVTTDLASLAADAQSTASGATASRPAAAPEPAALADTLRPADSERATVGSARAPRKRLRVSLATGGAVTAALLVLALLVTRGSWLPAGESPLARSLMQVAEAVEAYQAEHYRLPESLSELEGFPKDAVERKVEDYELILVPPKLEFFFGLDRGSYYLIARYDNEAWLYGPQYDPALSKIVAR